MFTKDDTRTVYGATLVFADGTTWTSGTAKSFTAVPAVGTVRGFFTSGTDVREFVWTSRGAVVLDGEW